MSIETHGVINKQLTTEEILNTVESTLGVNAEIVSEYTDIGVSKIGFTYNDEERMLSCVSESALNYYEKEYGFIDSNEYTTLMLGYWGESVPIMDKIVSEYGGWVSENDINGLNFKPVEKEIDF